MNARLKKLAVLAFITTLYPSLSHAQLSCEIGRKGLQNTSFVLNEVIFTNQGPNATTNNNPALNLQIEISFDADVTATKSWGAAVNYQPIASNKILLTSSLSYLSSGVSARFGLKGRSKTKITNVTCQVVNSDSSSTTPPVVVPPVVTPPVVIVPPVVIPPIVTPPIVIPPSVTPPIGTPPTTVPISSTDKCGLNNAGYLLVQSFETFTPGIPALSQEGTFKKEFCIPPKSIAGFGNAAESGIEKFDADRAAREAAGQYNGASDRVRFTVEEGTHAIAGKMLKVLYPKGGNTSSHSGAQFDMLIPGAQAYDRNLRKITGDLFLEELYISYWVKVPEDFDWQFGGKLPGLYGLEGYNASSRDNEIKSRLMWREDGKLEFYLHAAPEERERLLWDNIPGKSHIALTKGRWHNIEFRMKLNTVSGGTVSEDGILQGWLDGQLSADYRDMRFRTSADVNLNAVFFSTFYGGSSGRGRPDEIWWPNKDNFAWFDEVIVSRTPINNR